MSSDAREPQPQYDELGSLKTGGPARFWFGSLTALLNIGGTILIIAMAIAVNADVLGRDLFNQPITGVNEFLGLSIVAVVFLQIANTLREGRHVSNDIIMSAIGLHYPHVAHAFYGLFHLIGAGLMAFIVWFVTPMFLEMYQQGYYLGTQGVREIPVWPFVLPVIVGGTVSAIQYLLFAAQEFAFAFGHGRRPA
jgi:TRAP-type mannitol/chloroaromatic compound transport system permease small subunit